MWYHSQFDQSNVSTLVEPKLTIQSLHRYSSLIFIKINSSLEIPSSILIRSLGIIHHMVDAMTFLCELKNGDVVINPNYPVWIQNDGLLTTWLLGTMSIDVLCFIFDLDNAFQV